MRAAVEKRPALHKLSILALVISGFMVDARSGGERFFNVSCQEAAMRKISFDMQPLAVMAVSSSDGLRILPLALELNSTRPGRSWKAPMPSAATVSSLDRA